MWERDLIVWMQLFKRNDYLIDEIKSSIFIKDIYILDMFIDCSAGALSVLPGRADFTATTP